ncbi:hypothetical protein D3C76_771900 [compost metagenome]
MGETEPLASYRTPAVPGSTCPGMVNDLLINTLFGILIDCLELLFTQLASNCTGVPITEAPEALNIDLYLSDAAIVTTSSAPSGDCFSNDTGNEMAEPPTFIMTELDASRLSSSLICSGVRTIFTFDSPLTGALITIAAADFPID